MRTISLIQFNVESISRSIAKTIAITIGFAALYYGLCMATVNLSEPILSGLPALSSLRIASGLRAFTLWLGPPVVIGTMFGSALFAGEMGDLLAFVQIGTLISGLLVWQLSKMWGRSTVKDITLLVLYGILTGIIVGLKNVGVGLLLSPEEYKPLIMAIFSSKLVVKILVMLIFYPIARRFENAWSSIK